MSQPYKVTLITPFHNTDMSMFRNTYRSVRNQTIGFDNIEWIIVLHNCRQEYIDAVRELAGEAENVKLMELVNEARSASSPRNYGLQFVTSPYIEFLDSDDTIHPKTMEKCVEEMEKHHAQVVVFRMAYQKQNESVQSVITDVTLWNPLEDEIILTGERLRCEELFSSINFCTHNRFFDAGFIASNHIRFDEQITMAEDAFFTLTCYSKAEKIVVLPNFIGHYYFVNSDSAVQRMDKAARDVLHFSYGFKKMFDLLLDIHAYYNHFFLTILTAYINYAHCSHDFTPEDWNTLRKDMGPYARMITPPPVNKFFSEEEGMMLYGFIRRDLIEPADHTQTDYDNGARKLTRILRNNKNTAFGKYYDFKNITSIEEYRDKVPLYDHHKYEKLIRLHTQVGESDLVTPKTIKAYAYDFNESDEIRSVPVTEDNYKELGKKFINRINSETTFLMMESIPKGMPLNDGTFYDSADGIMVKSGIDGFSLSYSGLDDKLTSPFSLLFPVGQVNTDYLNLLLALRNEDVTQIYGSNTWIVLNYVEKILEMGEKLCDDIENGTIRIPHEENSKAYQRALTENTPNPDRARQIREALRSGRKDRLFSMIWPKLKRVLARSEGNFSFYTKKLRKYLGEVCLESDDFITPFGMISERTGDKNLLRLNEDAGFYEFLPADGTSAPKPLLKSEIRPGHTYELILTNDAGIYRMHTNLFIRPVRVTKNEFLFEECMKPLMGNDRLLCEGDVFEEILEKVIGDTLYDYICYYNKEKNRLEILLETDGSLPDGDLSSLIEQQLLPDHDYALAKEKGLNACHARIIDKETCLLWRDIRRSKFHAPAECFKPIHNIENIDLVPVLKNMITDD